MLLQAQLALSQTFINRKIKIFQAFDCPLIHVGSSLEYIKHMLTPSGLSNSPKFRGKGRSESRKSLFTAHGEGSVRYAERQQTTQGGLSNSPSETTSFRQRETELATIEKRFGQVSSRQKSSSPFTSRFKEDFGVSREVEKKTKPLVPKILVTLPGRTKTTSRSHSEAQDGVSDSCYSLPTYKNKSQGTSQAQKWVSDVQLRSTLRPPHEMVYQQTGVNESAAEVWQRAIRLEAEKRKGNSLHSGARSSDRSRLSPRPSSQATSSNTQIHYDPSESTHKFRPPFSYSQEGSQLPIPPLTEPAWWSNTTFIQGFPKRPRRLAVPPESWARYPSHTRESRNAHATAIDNVISKDFAVCAVSSDGQLQRVTNRSASIGMHSLSLRSASLPARLGQTLKTRLIELFNFRGKFSDTKNNILDRGPTSLELTGDVEYTDLGVLPPGIGHLLEPEQVAERLSSRRSEALSSRKSFTDSLKRAQRHQSTSNSVAKEPDSEAEQYHHSSTYTAESSDKSRTRLRIPRNENHLAPKTGPVFPPLNTSLAPNYKGKNKPLNSRLSTAKSEQMLAPSQVSPKRSQGAGRLRSFT